jgi:predicted dehydrogenase
MNPVRYGIIGAGAIAHYMARAFTENQGAVAQAVADVNRAAAEAIAAKVQAPAVYTDYRDMLARADLDAIYVATPPFLHRPMVLAALAAGKHVCCEKPMVINLGEARDIAAALSAAPGLKFTCCASRFHASGTARRARDLIASGDLGEVYRVHFEQVTNPPPPGATLPAWRNDPAKNGGGISFDWGPYDLDWLGYVLGPRFRPHTVFAHLHGYFPLTPERVPPAPDVDGQVVAEILCDDGLSVHWERRAGEHGPARHAIEVRGTRAGLDLTFVPMGADQSLRRHAYAGAAELATTVIDATPPDWDNTMVYPIRDLTRAIRENSSPSNTLADNLRTHAIYAALYASARTGQAAAVEPWMD